MIPDRNSHVQRHMRSVICAAALVAGCAMAANVSADWPMFRGGPSLVGVASGKLEKQLKLLWTFKTEKPVKSSPAIAKNRGFIGSDDGNLYAIDFGSGKKLWSFKTEGTVESSPLVLEERVYVGSSDANLYAVNADGKLAWKYQTGDKIL